MVHKVNDLNHCNKDELDDKYSVNEIKMMNNKQPPQNMSYSFARKLKNHCWFDCEYHNSIQGLQNVDTYSVKQYVKKLMIYLMNYHNQKITAITQ